ncbi:MAG: hypothetical protein CMF55_00705 [Legionellales bacterium]|nr:hypothetical protein [Legionellales bacterium]
MIIHDKGLVRKMSSSSDGLRHLFRICGDFPSSGPFTITWKDDEGINYVASINVRAELDVDYDNLFMLPDEKREREKIISEETGQENEGEDWA